MFRLLKILAKIPGVAREKKSNFEKKFVTPVVPKGSLKKLQPIWFSFFNGVKPYRNPTYGPATYSNMAYFPGEHFFYIFEIFFF